MVGTVNGHVIEKDIPSDAALTDTIGIWYCTCSTAAAEREKIITPVNSGFELKAGTMINVKYSVSNSYASTAAAPVLLNVASTGGKPVWYNNAASPTGASTGVYGYANRHNQYIYDGTYWVWAGYSVDSNTTYAGYSFGFGYGQCDTAAATVAKACTISNYALGAGGIVAIEFTYDVPAYATLNIRTRGAKEIYYRGEPIGEGVIKAGDIATFMYGDGHYQLLAIDRNIEIATVNETKSYLGIT